MAKLPTGLHQRTGSNVWQQRVVIPTDLRHLYRTSDGNVRTFVRVSLNTRDLGEAKRKSFDTMNEWATKFSRQRAQGNPTKIALTPGLLALLQDRIRHDILALDDVRRTDPANRDHWALWVENIEIPNSPIERLNYMRGLDAAHAEAYRQLAATGTTDLGRNFADAVAKELGFAVDWTGQGAALLALTRTVTQARIDVLRRSEGEVIDTPPAPETGLEEIADKLEPVKKPGRSPSHSLADVIMLWSKDKAQDAINKANRAVALMEDAGLSTALNSVSSATGEDFVDWLTDSERSFGATTAKHHFNQIKTLLIYAVDKLKWLPSNPWRGVEAPKGRKARRIPWSHEDLQALTSTPLFQAYALPDDRRAGGAAAYWIPLLGMYSGARLSELCNLRVVDVKRRDGVLLMDINEEAGSVKSEAGIRQVPVHAELVRLGFEDYVADRKAAKCERLFDLYEQPSRPGPTYFSDFFRDMRNEAGIATRWQDFHALRTTVSTAMRGAHPAISETIIDAVLGHESAGSVGATNYTRHGPRALQRAIEAVDHGLNLPRVFKVS
jgi:integrase